MNQHVVKYRPDIDGLRAIAVLLVVFFHAFPAVLPSGFIGVDIFFVISGFLISSIILTQIKADSFRIRDFYVRRIRRIFPAFLLVTAVTLFIGWFVLFPSEYADLGQYALASAAFVANIVFYRQIDYFAPDMATQPLIHTWSLSVEEQFYLIWPLVLYWSRWRRLMQIGLMVTIWVLSFATNIWLVGSDINAAFYWPIPRFWELASGSIAAWIMQERPSWYVNAHQRMREHWATIGWLMVVIGVVLISKERVFPGYWALLPVLGTTWLILAGDSAWFNAHVLSQRWLVGIGLISYPLYLWHWPLLVYVDMVIPADMQVLAHVMAMLVSAGLAYLTYRLLETPIRRGVAQQWVVAVLLVCMVGVAALGWMMSREGIPVRIAAIAERQDVRAPLAQADSMDVVVGCDPWGESGKLLTACWRHMGRTDAPEFVVIGDSHATVMMAGFVAQAPSKTSLLLARHGCPPLLGVDRMGNGYDVRRVPCSDATQAMLDIVRTLQTNPLRTVFVFGRYNLLANTATQQWMYVPDTPSGYFDLVENLNTPLRTPYEQVLKTGYTQFLAELATIPAQRIVIVLQVPELDTYPLDCLRRFYTDQWCRVVRVKVAAHMAQTRQILRDSLQAYPNIEIVDPFDVFCDNTYCYGAKDATLRYRDDHHVNSVGAQRLVEALIAQIQ
jgi:peptidoglycan/LPS O-acetylase OafA/YrhL